MTWVGLTRSRAMDNFRSVYPWNPALRQNLSTVVSLTRQACATCAIENCMIFSGCCITQSATRISEAASEG